MQTGLQFFERHLDKLVCNFEEEESFETTDYDDLWDAVCRALADYHVYPISIRSTLTVGDCTVVCVDYRHDDTEEYELVQITFKP